MLAVGKMFGVMLISDWQKFYNLVVWDQVHLTQNMKEVFLVLSVICDHKPLGQILLC